MKITKTASGKQTIKISKSEWTSMGKEAGWIKKSSVTIDQIKTNPDRPSKIKQIMDLYVEMHPQASGYELNTLWNDIGQMTSESINQYVDKFVSKWTNQNNVNNSATKEDVKGKIQTFLTSIGSEPFINDSDQFDPAYKGGLWFGDRNEEFQAYTPESEELQTILNEIGWTIEPYDFSTFIAMPKK
jgi:hypothetical protein